MELSLLILVCIHKSYVVYLEIYVVPIGHGFSSFFWSWKSHGKSVLKKRGHPVEQHQSAGRWPVDADSARACVCVCVCVCVWSCISAWHSMCGPA